MAARQCLDVARCGKRMLISPSSDVLPEFVPMLNRHQVVLPDAFGSRANRQRRALDIVSDASKRVRRP